MYGDLNGYGNLFGGKALAWIDLAGGIAVMNTAKDHNFVTKYISEINFRAPATVNDVIKIIINIIEFGTTSITLTCEMVNNTTEEVILTVDKMVFVQIDDNGKPIPHNLKFK